MERNSIFRWYNVGGPGIHTMVIDRVGVATVVATADAVTDFADGKRFKTQLVVPQYF